MIRQKVQTSAVVLFIVLLPFLAYSIWDYAEATRLRGRFSAVIRSGAPLALPYHRPTGEAADAERYYRAAAALVLHGDSGASIASNGAWRSIRQGEWTPGVIALARAETDKNRDALEFVDRAAALPFDDFLVGSSYSYRAGDLLALARVCEFRAAAAAAGNDGDAALASLYSEARLARAFESTSTASWTVVAPAFTGLTFVLERTRPSAVAVDRLAGALAALDRDDRLKEAFVRFRATMLNQVMTSPPSRQPGPLIAHLTVRSLDGFSALIAEADEPWTTRLAAVNAVGVWPQPNLFALGAAGRTRLESYTRAVGEQVRRIRCARLYVAGGNLDLVDPFSGKRLEVMSCQV